MQAFTGHVQPDQSMLPAPFQSAKQFRLHFEGGLTNLLLTSSQIGEDILVLANANFHGGIWQRLGSALQLRLQSRADEFAQVRSSGNQPPGAPDDVATFNALLTQGIHALRPVRTRREGPWELQHNPLRGLRPARHSQTIVKGIRRDFDPAQFHFDKPFLRREMLWEGTLCGRAATLLYNKFPFADFHGLLVPEIAQHRPQFLDGKDLVYLWELGEVLHEALPGFGIAYNSYGAHASVNHLHLQTFLREIPLPIADPRWTHNGGSQAYPLASRRLDELWQMADNIAGLHAQTTPYHLIFTGGAWFCIPRQAQGLVNYPRWLGALAWLEAGGGFSLLSDEDFLHLGATDIAAAMAACAINEPV
jgi:hypothetical protein